MSIDHSLSMRLDVGMSDFLLSLYGSFGVPFGRLGGFA